MRTESHYLFDILNSCGSIKGFIGDKTFDDFEKDNLLRSGVLMQLFIIGEAVAKLSDRIKEDYPDVPWSAIRGFRNFVAHQYFAVHWDVVWKSAKERVPEVAASVEQILRNEYPGARPPKQ